MNGQVNIAALIEKNRIALLRMVFCWLSAAYFVNVRGNKPLPRRLARLADDLVATAEKATGYLLISIFYHSQIDKRFSPEFERGAMRRLAVNKSITLRVSPVIGIIKRLKALRHLLLNLPVMARRMGESVAGHARVQAMKTVAFLAARMHCVQTECLLVWPEDAIPP